jgi:hypothetical protein
MKTLSPVLLLFFSFAASAFANVVVSAPSNGETVSSTVSYAASATSSTCSKGVASMGVYVDNELLYVNDGAELKTTLPVSPGKHKTVVEEWDYCGDATFVSMEITSSSQTGVYVTSPASGSSVSSPANYEATATSSCSKGVASMGVYVNNQLVASQNGAKLNIQVNLGSGAQQTVVEEWDRCGGATYSTVNVTVARNGTKLSNLQTSAGWQGRGQLPPIYADCSPCAGLGWSLVQGVTSPSLSGKAAQFNTDGTTPYGVVLWYNPVIGQFSTQGLPDDGHILIPSLHNFTYYTDLYVTNASVTQVLEFDVSMYMDGIGMFFGTQCNHLGGGEWDVLNNETQRWESAGVPCNLVNGWNHLTLQFQRGSGNTLLYQWITLNGVTYNINKTYTPFEVPPSWYGVTVNYQMDGNSRQTANTTYLDNFNLTYW